MINIGIECESIEGQSWGVGRIISKLLQNIANRPELAKEFRFFLYFKSRVPDLAWLDNPIFIKKIVRLPLLPPSFSLYYYLFLPIKLWFERLDLMFFPNYMLPIIFRGRSLVILTEDVYYETKNEQLPSRYRLAYKIFANWAARHATRIMAISETSKKEVARLFKIAPGRIFVNPLGVESPESASHRPPEASGYLLYVGQAFPRRHLRETMLAFEKISHEFPDLKLIAVGYDKYNPPIIQKLKDEINSRLGRDAIIYKEFVPESELSSLYTGARAVIYVSSKEAFGLPPLEGLAYGVPPVVAESELNIEIYGDNAFFADEPDNPDSIAAAIKKALTDVAKRREIIANVGMIARKYNWQAHTDRFLTASKNQSFGKENSI